MLIICKAPMTIRAGAPFSIHKQRDGRGWIVSAPSREPHHRQQVYAETFAEAIATMDRIIAALRTLSTTPCEFGCGRSIDACMANNCPSRYNTRMRALGQPSI